MTATRRPQPALPLTRAVVRFAVLLAILGLGFALVRWTPVGQLVDRERLVAWLEALRGAWWSAPVLVALWAALGPIGVPVSAFVVAGGAIFGTFWGWIYNLIGALLSAAAAHMLARHLGRELIAHVLGPQRVERLEGLVDTHGFWTFVRLRFLPLPFVAVNFGAALAGMPLGRFLAATAVGLTPALLVWTYCGAALVRAAEGARLQVLAQLALGMALLLALSFLPRLWRPRHEAGGARTPSDDRSAGTRDR